MRRGAALAIAVVAVLILSALLAVPTAVRAGPVSASGTHTESRPAATDSIFPTNQYGYYRTTFYLYASDDDTNVYFDASDSVDGNVTVTINDYNATRDGLTNPVAHLTAHIVGGVNDSWDSSTYLAIPLSVLYPGTWNLTIDGTTAGFYSTNFSVETYYVEADSNQSIVLPGHSVTTSYWVESELNESLWNHLSKVTVKGMYYTNATVPKWIALPGTPANLGTGDVGSFTWTVPANASTSEYVQLEFIANTTGWSVSGYSYVYPAALLTPIVTLSTCADNCYSSTFDSGQTIVATATELMQSYDGRSPVSGVELKILYEAGKTVITPNGTPPTSLTTNANGQAQWLFSASTGTGQFSTSMLNYVSVRPIDPVLASNDGNFTNVSFSVLKTTTAAPGVQITFGSAQYYGGDTIFVNWTLTGNATVTKGWVADLWYAEEYAEGEYYGYTELPGGNLTGVSGSFTLPAPLGFTGYIYVEVGISNATQESGGENYIDVSPPQVLLTSNDLEYQAGSTVSVTIVTLGSLSGDDLVSLVTDSDGQVLLHGAVTGTTLSVTVPTTAPPDWIEWTVFALSSSGATITNATLYTDLIDGYGLTVGVGTQSSYTDGSYQPGNTIQVTYQITALGYATMPKAWTIEIWPENAWENSGGNVEDFETTATSGSVSYTIPSNTPNGIQQFWVEAYPSGGSGTYDVESSIAVDVQSNPSSLGLELGAGSGLTVGWIVLLVIIVVVAIVLFLAIRTATRPKVMSPTGGSPPPSSPPPQAWQESSSPDASSAGGSTPPSQGPTPPPGST
jgi:hypothetical protein